MLLFYNLAIRCYYLFIKIASPFHEKAAKWVDGRKAVFSLLQNVRRKNNKPVIWMHCASLGEFEQGRPILEQLRLKYPNYFLLLTFYSPSGYEIRKNYSEVDYVCYLPLDTAENAKWFLDIVQPHLAIFVKYEFWYHFLTILRQRGTPTILISAIFRKNQPFFKPWGSLFRKMLRSFTHLFVQDESSKVLLENLGLDHLTLSGDTRVDRVLQIAQSAEAFPAIASYIQKEKVMICGSTWPKDEAHIHQWYTTAGSDWNIIIAPHDIQEKRLRELESLFAGQTVRFSQLSNKSLTNQSVLIIDNIGMLSSIYQYGTIAYVGGGFGTSIHSILEPAAFGLPICFGPNYNKFREAKLLVEQGGAFVVGDLSNIVRQLSDKASYLKCKRIVEHFIMQNKGATATVMRHVSELLEAKI